MLMTIFSDTSEAIRYLSAKTHTHALEKLHVKTGKVRAILTLPPASQSYLFMDISHTNAACNNMVTKRTTSCKELTKACSACQFPNG